MQLRVPAACSNAPSRSPAASHLHTPSASAHCLLQSLCTCAPSAGLLFLRESPKHRWSVALLFLVFSMPVALAADPCWCTALPQPAPAGREHAAPICSGQLQGITPCLKCRPLSSHSCLWPHPQTPSARCAAFMEKGLSMAAGQTPVQKYWKHLLRMIQVGWDATGSQRWPLLAHC